MIKLLSLILFSLKVSDSGQNAIFNKTFDIKFDNVGSSELCDVQLSYFQKRLDQSVLWARQLRDAWGNIPAGIFSGNLFDFGNFDQCINFKYNSEAVGEIIGQHCTLIIPFDLHDTSDRVAKLMPPSRRFDSIESSLEILSQNKLLF